MFVLDHLAVAATNLRDGAAWVSNALGVPLQVGGTHARYGTHNMLLGLTDGLYLEVIAKDPHAPATGAATWFDLDRFSGPPRLANWICRADDLARYRVPAGPARNLERGDLRWAITVPDDGSLPHGGAFPTLIKWAAGTKHPATRLPQSGLHLVEFIVSHPHAETIAAEIPLSDARIKFVRGASRFSAVFDGPQGRKVL